MTKMGDTLLDMWEFSKPKPESHGTLFMHCTGAQNPKIEIKKREDGQYILIINSDVYIYMSGPEQLNEIVDDIDTKRRAALDGNE